jgi:hypothetical protein
MSRPDGTILVTYENEPVALASAHRIEFLPAATELRPGHPRLRLFMYMVRYAELVARGERPRPYADADAERFARRALIDPEALAAHGDENDQELADRFTLPVEQLAKARWELVTNATSDSSRAGLSPWDLAG